MSLSTEPKPMKGAINWAPTRNEKKALVPPTVMLALWRLRRTWKLLLFTAVGMIAAIMLVCAVPLYSQTAMTAGLRGSLVAAPQNADVTVQSISQLVDAHVTDTATQELNQEFQQDLGPYLGPPQLFSQTGLLPVLVNPLMKDLQNIGEYVTTGAQVQINGFDVQDARSHLQLIQGQLPSPTASYTALSSTYDLDVALSVQSTQALHATIGSQIKTTVRFTSLSQQQTFPITLHIVGIFQLPNTNDLFWHGHDFQPVPPPPSCEIKCGNMYPLLALNGAFEALFTFISNQPGLDPRFDLLQLNAGVTFFWYYHLDPSRITIGDLDSILNGITTAKTNISNNVDLNQVPYLNVSSYPSGGLLEEYHDRATVAHLPMLSLLVLMIGLIVFFVSMMTDLLVDRQTEAIAVLHSRGASRRQIFGSLLTQSVVLTLFALLVGPLLALLLVGGLVQTVLASSNQSTLKLIFNAPWAVIWSLRWYVLITVGVAILAMTASINRATRLDVLAIRRESARSTQRPLWQRFNLDIVAALIATVGYGVSVYMANSDVLDAQRRLLLLTPLTLLGLVCLLVAALLAFLRLFPWMLRLAASGASRSRGAAPLLALAQMARGPRQALRMMLLLALSTSFALFTLVFSASETQHVLDVAAYQTGADFSGTLAYGGITAQQVRSETSAYRHIPGVLSATVGYTGTAASVLSATESNFDLRLQAVDADTYAATAIWPQEDRSQPLAPLMVQLSAQRESAIAKHLVPAILDSVAWGALQLSPGATFTLKFSDGPLNFVALAEVPYLPPSLGTALLVDYPSFAKVYINQLGSVGGSIPLDAVWLRTSDDPAALARVRHVLNDPKEISRQLQTVSDRRESITLLQQEPLYLGLLGVLALGASVALLLALLGNLLASWLTAQSRLTNFAVLRALGAASRHIASVLTWEQSLIYTTSLVLGILLGTLLSVVVVPVLVFTGVAPSSTDGALPSGQFFLSQSIPPIQIVVPLSLGIALGVLIVICLGALWMMVRIVSRPSISQTLRLNED